VGRRFRDAIEWRRHFTLVRSRLDPLPQDLRSGGGIWAVGVVHDEVDILGSVISNLVAQGVERVIVADNLSTDGTAELLGDLAGRLPVTVLSDRLPAHYQSQKITALASAAARAGAGWVMPFDADEVWLAPGTTLADWLGGCDAMVVQVPVFNHVPTDHDDPREPDPLRRLRWRKSEPNRLHKVVFRAHPRARVLDGNHGVRLRGERRRGLQIRHFPYRSEDQFIRKMRRGSAVLSATDLSPEVGQHWRGMGERDEAALSALWRQLVETHNLPIEWWVPRTGVVEDAVVLPPLTASH